MPFLIFRVRTVAAANVAGYLLGAPSSRTSSADAVRPKRAPWSAPKTGVTFVATAGTAILGPGWPRDA